MAQSLISLITLATIVAAAPLERRQEPTGDLNCVQVYWTVAGDTCESIATKFNTPIEAITGENSFLTCDDIWVNTPLCIPGFPDVTISSVPTTTVDVSPSQSCYTYTSQAGDTCASIAAAFGLTADEIYAANTFLNCQDIWNYTPICIPVPQPTATITGTFYPVQTCSFTYTSVQGDTCDTLAVRFHVTADEILAYNSFLSCDNIWVNTPICVPPIDPITSFIISDSSTTVPVPTCSVTYTSVDGDTCDVIGSKFGVSGNAIYQANTFLTCNSIWPWTPVCIPFPATGPYSKRA